MQQMPQRAIISTRRLRRIVYCQRGLRLREFTDMCDAADFADAVRILTGVRECHRRDLKGSAAPREAEIRQE